MKRMVYQYCQSPIVNQINDMALLGVEDVAKDREICRRLFYWVKRNVKFEEDEVILASQLQMNNMGKELLIAPDALFSMPTPMGDCDDFSLLLACLLKNVHFQIKFVTIACDYLEPDRFSHIYLKAYLEDEGRWISLDCSHGGSPGWEFNNGVMDNMKIFRKVEWNV